MEVLLIIYLILGIVSLLLQYFLYQKEAQESIYLINMVIGILLAFIAFSSFPSNYTGQRFLALIFGLTGASAIFVKETVEQEMIPKIMLSISIFANFALLLS